MQIGRYRFVDRLAVGGMAEVFVAIAHGSEGFEKPVVIKRLLPQLARIPRFQQMILDEARITANLQHGNIVQILDMGRMQELPFLAFEYVDGKDLRSVFQRAEERAITLPMGLMAYVAAEVCRALDYAHRKCDELGQSLHIVHRDINPANIFLSYEGVVKVGDFGLAKARDNMDQSEAGVVKGKFSYLSPEQAKGLPLDHRSDLFSLGTTLYELTCMQRPFLGATDLEIVMSIQEGRHQAPSAIIKDYPPALEAVVEKALQPTPDQRYSTAAEMQADLVRYLQQLPVIPNDGHLADFLGQIFTSERRSHSSLIRLSPVNALPPPMTFIPSSAGISIFQESEGSPLFGSLLDELPPGMQVSARRDSTAPRLPAPRSPRPPTAEQRPRPPTAEQRPRPPTAEQRPVASAVTEPPARARRMLWLGAGILGLLVLIGVGILLFRALNPPAANLSLTSTPSGARIFLNGKDTGQKTPTVLKQLTLQTDYLVVLHHPEAATTQRHFRFTTEGVHFQAFTMTPHQETLALNSEPTASEISINGETVGRTPLTTRLRRGKKHLILIQREGYETKVVQHLARQEHASLLLKLEPKEPSSKRDHAPRRPAKKTRLSGATGTLEILTNFRGTVQINGKKKGRTPNFRAELPVGRYFIQVLRDDSNIRHEATIDVVKDRLNRFTLTPPQP